MRKIVVFLATLSMFLLPSLGLAEGALEKRVNVLEEALSQVFFQQVKISGAIEAEAGYSSDYDDVKESDFDLTTLELGIDVSLSDSVSGFVLMKWEEDGDEGVFVDEGGVTIGNADAGGFLLTVGKLSVPFGIYETGLVSDPLTLELGETREGAIKVDFSSGGFYGAVYAFNSAINDDDEDDMVDAFGASAGYSYEVDGMSADVSLCYISNLTSSGGFSGYLEEEGYDVLKDYSAGMTLSAVVNVADFTLIGEYLTALDHDYLAAAKDEPATWNLEVGYAFALSEHAASLAVAYQGSDEAAFLGLPETRLAAAFRYEIVEGLGLAFEIAHDEDYAETDGSSGESADSATCQLALEF